MLFRSHYFSDVSYRPHKTQKRHKNKTSVFNFNYYFTNFPLQEYGYFTFSGLYLPTDRGQRNTCLKNMFMHVTWLNPVIEYKVDDYLKFHINIRSLWSLTMGSNICTRYLPGVTLLTSRYKLGFAYSMHGGVNTCAKKLTNCLSIVKWGIKRIVSV